MKNPQKLTKLSLNQHILNKFMKTENRYKMRKIKSKT
jgi:hypothetical protein